jgi:hypothetical protein
MRDRSTPIPQMVRRSNGFKQLKALGLLPLVAAKVPGEYECGLWTPWTNRFAK